MPIVFYRNQYKLQILWIRDNTKYSNSFLCSANKLPLHKYWYINRIFLFPVNLFLTRKLFVMEITLVDIYVSEMGKEIHNSKPKIKD